MGKPISISVNGFGGKGILFENGYMWIGFDSEDEKRTLKVYDKVLFHDNDKQ